MDCNGETEQEQKDGMLWRPSSEKKEENICVSMLESTFEMNESATLKYFFQVVTVEVIL